MTRWLYALIALTLSTVAPAAHAQAPATTGPSFSCTGATGTAAIVCGDKVLSAEDRTLTALYGAARTSATGVGASNELAAQRKWLHDLDSQCAPATFAKTGAKTPLDCVKSRYDTRVTELAQAALFTDHAAAMTELRRLAPDDAPIYEAIWLYGTIDDAKQRRARVSAALAPVYATFDSDTKNELKEMDGPVTADAAAASDKAFGTFVDMADVEANRGVGWPCAAIVKRPGLIDAVGPLYGSTRDGMLPYDDCEDTASPVPAFTAFAGLSFEGVEDCGGTIRFAGYKTFHQFETAALLHRSDIWAKPSSFDGGKPEARFRAKHAAEIARAKAGLADYYTQTLKVDAKTATHDATTIVDLMIGQAYDPCD